MKTPRLPKLWEALLTLGFLIGLMAAAILVYEVDPHIPMFIGALAAALMALRVGYRWKDVENFMFDGIQRVLQSLIILVIIGILIGVWLNAGVVPAMIYYGLKILNPTIFLVVFGLCLLLNVISALVPTMLVLRHSIIYSIQTKR